VERAKKAKRAVVDSQAKLKEFKARMTGERKEHALADYSSPADFLHCTFHPKISAMSSKFSEYAALLWPPLLTNANCAAPCTSVLLTHAPVDAVLRRYKRLESGEGATELWQRVKAQEDDRLRDIAAKKQQVLRPPPLLLVLLFATPLLVLTLRCSLRPSRGGRPRRATRSRPTSSSPASSRTPSRRSTCTFRPLLLRVLCACARVLTLVCCTASDTSRAATRWSSC